MTTCMMSLVNPEWFHTNTACVNVSEDSRVVCILMYYAGVRV
jgi:hypothetical protein